MYQWYIVVRVSPKMMMIVLPSSFVSTRIDSVSIMSAVFRRSRLLLPHQTRYNRAPTDREGATMTTLDTISPPMSVLLLLLVLVGCGIMLLVASGAQRQELRLCWNTMMGGILLWDRVAFYLIYLFVLLCCCRCHYFCCSHFYHELISSTLRFQSASDGLFWWCC